MISETASLQFPAVFAVLSELLSKPEADRSNLTASLCRLEEQMEGRYKNESYAFAPFILHKINAIQMEDCLSPSLLEKFQSISRNAAARSLSRDLAMQKVARVLQEHQCDALLLKGAALDNYIYEREAFRQGVDVDLLVTEPDFDRMEQMLSGIAYKLDTFPDKPAHSRAAAQASYIIDTPIPVGLDVHYQYAQEGIYQIKCEDLFKRSSLHPAHAPNLRLMQPEDNLIHFAIHGFKDKSLFQKQTVDAYLLIGAEEIDWRLLVERAQDCAALMPLIYLMEGMRQVFGFRPPDSVQSDLELKGVRRTLVNAWLADKPTPGVRTGVSYRVRQLSISWLLSGNFSGYLRQQIRFLGNSVSDKLKS